MLRMYYQSTQAVIWVVDASDRARFEESRQALVQALNEDELAGVPLLVLANKSDLPGAADAPEVASELDLTEDSALTLKREWHVMPASACTGDGLEDALEWVAATLRAKTPRVGSFSLAW